MKHCPNCGTKLPANADFCPECGTALKRQAPRQAQKKMKKQRHWGRKGIITLVVVALLVIGGGTWYLLQQGDPVEETTTSQVSASSSSKASHKKRSSSSSETAQDETAEAIGTKQVSGNQSSTTTRSSKGQSTSSGLSTNLGPKETAASILYYGAKKVDDLFQGNYEAVERSQRLYVTTDKVTAFDDGAISHPGQGVVYYLTSAQTEPSIGYTLDKDQTVNFYEFEVGSEPEYKGSAKWQDIVDYINKADAADTIHSLGKVTDVSNVHDND